MAEIRGKKSAILLSFFHPILSTLPLTLFFQDELKTELFFPFLVISVQTILVAGAIPVFRSFCRNQLYTFEDQENALNTRIILVSLIVGVAAAVATAKLNLRHVFIALPYVIAMVFSYVIVFFDFLIDNKIGGIVKLAYIHYRKATSMIVAFIISKIIYIIILYYLKYEFTYLLLTFSGFAADIILLIIIRFRIYALDIQIDGFSRNQISSFRGLIIVPIMILSGAVSLVTTGNKSIISPEMLLRFYRWLSSFFFHIPIRSAELLPDPRISEPYAEGLDDLSSMIDVTIIQYPAFLGPLLRIIGIALFVLLGLFIIYLLFYPLIRPLFSIREERITFKEYYLNLYNKLKENLLNLRKLILSIFEMRSSLSQYQNAANVSSESGNNFTSAITPGKRAELKALKKQYIKLRKWTEKKQNFTINNSLSVEEFFSLLSQSQPGNTGNCNNLAAVFNKSFFSSDELTREESLFVKAQTAQIIKPDKNPL